MPQCGGAWQPDWFKTTTVGRLMSAKLLMRTEGLDVVLSSPRYNDGSLTKLRGLH